MNSKPIRKDAQVGLISGRAIVGRGASSSWTAFRNRRFRAIWLASVVSGTCASAHGTVATWVANQLSQSTLLLSMMSTFISLPFFLFTLPAGALADMVDRAKLVRITHIWLAASAAGLAIVGWLHLLDANLLLLFVFLIGAGLAFNGPAFSSLLSDIVSDEELPSASVLSGLQLDIAGMIGPVLGGALVPLIGANAVFATNGACFLLINLALLKWSQPKGQAHSAVENFFQSFATAVHYVRYAPGVQVILARQILFSMLVVAIPALLPVIALKELHADAAYLGLLYTSMGVGSVVTASFLLPWARANYSPNTLTRLAGYLLALVIFSMAFVRQTQLLLVVTAVAGIAWTSTANELWLAGQRAMPRWARGRMNAAIMTASQGAMALGGVIFGATAQTFGLTGVLTIVAILILILSLTYKLLSPLSIDFTQSLSFECGAVTLSSQNFIPQNFIHVPRPQDGPVLITIDFQVDEAHGHELDSFIEELRLIHLRNGAYSWQLFEDPARPDRFRIGIMMPSWSQYLLHNERITQPERQIIDRALSLHVGGNAPDVRTYVRVNRTFGKCERTTSG
jgi:MFS family permease